MPGEYIGAYSSFVGSPAYEGKLQFDLWDVTPDTGRYDWDSLKAEIKKHGLRNSLLIAPMPTASTAQICGNTEAFEPLNSNIYKRKTLAGEFILVNKHLRKDLMKLNLWNKEMSDKIMINNGSVQNILEIPEDIRNIYKTVWEIKSKVIIDMAIDRGAFICQSQSLNLFFEKPEYRKLTSAHFYAWSKKLKCSSYYIRSKPLAQTQQFTIDPTKAKNYIDQSYKSSNDSVNGSENEETTCDSCGA